MTFSAIRHRLLLSLALAPGLTVRELAAIHGESGPTISGHLQALWAYCLVEHVSVKARTFRLRPGVVVSEKGYVGYLVPLDLAPKPCVRLVGLESGR